MSFLLSSLPFEVEDAQTDASFLSSSLIPAEFHAPYDTFVVPKLAASLGKGAFNGLLEAGQVYNNYCALAISGSSK